MTQADSPRPVPVAIIGMGCLFPMADGLERFWANIRGRLDAITEVPPSHWRPDEYWAEDPKAPDRTYARRGGFLTPVDFPLLDFGIAPHAVEATDTSQLLGLLVARQALADAGYTPERELDRSRVSVILGVTGTLELVIPLGARLGHPIWRRALRESGVDDRTAEEVVARISDSYVGWQENSFPGLLGNVTAGRIANRLDLGGTNCVVDAACASSLGAVNLALLELAAGRCDMAVSGGIDTFNDIFMYMCFSKTPALSPTGDARPFDARSDGTILGEGLGLLVLKRLEDARRDGDRIYAVIRSMGTSSDGKGQAVYAPSAAGQVKALRQAYGAAGVEPSTIELVEAHGTGTRVGDTIEIEALEQVYRGARPEGRWCALGSIKSQLGHTKAAAGAAGLIKAALALHRKVLPPTIKVREPIEPLRDERSPFFLNADVRPWISSAGHPRRAAVSAFGFGGSNFHCLLEEAAPEMPGVDWGGDVQVLAYSGDDPTQVAASLPRWSGEADWAELRREAARSRSAFRTDHPVRLVLVAERGQTDLADLIALAAGRLRAGSVPAPSEAENRGIFVGMGRPEGSLAVLFPGQGSQYIGMLRDLACRFPRMQEVLECWDHAAGDASSPLSRKIYPPSSFREEDARADELALRATQVAQPAIGAISLGLLGILQDFGIRPDLVAGHSFGELTAACAAGRISVPDFVRLSLARGTLMAECGRGGDSGAMLAVFAASDEVSRLIEEHGLDVVIANRNAPRQCVLSGPKAQIDRAAERLSAAGLMARPLPVSAAFHSRFVADAQDEFRRHLDGVAFAPGSIRLYANTTGRAYPEDAEGSRELLAGQLARPVEFVAMVESMYAAGARTFLEVGPDSRLTGLVRSILEGRDHLALAVDDPRGRGETSDLRNLARTISSLAAIGFPVDLARWDEGHPTAAPAAPRKSLTVRVCGANAAPSARPGAADTQPERRRAIPVPDPIANRVSPQAGLARPGEDASSPEVPHPTHPERTMTPTSHQQSGHSTNGKVSPVKTSAAAPVSPGASAPTADHARAAIAPQPNQMLQQTQDGMLALQRLAEQTALLHRQFLEGQAETQRTLQALLERQRGWGDPHSAPARMTLTPPLATEPEPQQWALGAFVPTAPPSSSEPAMAIPREVPAGHDAAAVLLEVVAEKTGYPAEMLELGMQLDADLGIDSIKRVEILSAIQDRLPDAPAVGPDQAGTLRTLGQIAEFLARGPLAAPAGPSPLPNNPREQLSEASRPPVGALNCLTPRALVLVDGERERITLPAGSLVRLAAEPSSLTEAVMGRLVELEIRVELVTPDQTPLPPASADVAGLLILAPEGPAAEDHRFTKWAFAALRDAAGPLRRNGKTGGAVFATVSLLDGRFGLAGPEVSRPLDAASGALAGLAKTAHHEWPEVQCKAIDLDPAIAGDVAADRIVDHLFRRGPVEVGLGASNSYRVELTPSDPNIPAQDAPAVIEPGDVVVISGGARGITAEVALALAASSRPRLVLLGRTPVPEEEPPWLAAHQSEAAIRRAIGEHFGRHATPQKIQEQARLVLHQREIRRNLSRIQAAGSEVNYHAIDVRDAAAVREVIDRERREAGPIRGLVHGAGLLADRRIEDQTEEQFAVVFDTKVLGLEALLGAIDLDQLRFVSLFSSSTARFGRTGQVAYAAANEYLNKRAQELARRLHGGRVVSFNWGPWDGGMVTSALRSMFEHEGLGVIPLEAGARLAVQRIEQAAPGQVEVVVLAGAAPEESPADGGPVAEAGADGPIGRPRMEVVFERQVDLRSLPILRSHVIDGHAVLPMALILEWLAEGAEHRHPGMFVRGVDGLQLLKGLVLKDHRPVSVSIHVGRHQRRDGLFVVPVELHGQAANGRVLTHARGEVLLADSPQGGRPRLDAARNGGWSLGREEIYRKILFHGPAMQAIQRVDGCDERGVSAWVSTSPPPSAWTERPIRQGWLTDPLAIDAAFQAVVLWTREHAGSNSLPTAVSSYRQFRRAFPQGGVRVVAEVSPRGGHRAVADLEFLDSHGELVARIEGYECVIDSSLNQAFRRNRLSQLEVAAS